MTQIDDFDSDYEYHSYKMENARKFAEEMTNNDLLKAILWKDNLDEIRYIFKEVLVSRLCLN